MTEIARHEDIRVPEAATATALTALTALTASTASTASTAATADANTNTNTVSSFLSEGPLPQVCAFDLDYTIWGRDCDKDVYAPFALSFDGVVYDRFWRVASAFPEVAGLIGALVDAGVKIAFLSRNPNADSVEQLLRKCPIQSKDPLKRCLWDALSSRAYFHAYSSNGIGKGKDRHFASLRALTGVEFSQIVFFDDLGDNVKAAAAQGTVSIQVSTKLGLTRSALEVGIRAWRGTTGATN